MHQELRPEVKLRALNLIHHDYSKIAQRFQHLGLNFPQHRDEPHAQLNQRLNKSLVQHLVRQLLQCHDLQQLCRAWNQR